MYGDDDLWPVRCPRCGEFTHKKIGWLKTNTNLRCIGCETYLWYHNDAFVNALNDATRVIDRFSLHVKVGEASPKIVVVK
jgi:hypothetical protein